MAALLSGVPAKNHKHGALQRIMTANYSNNELDAIYDDIENAEAPGGQLPRLDIGTHVVAIDVYRGEKSKNPKKSLGTILKADFIVESSTVLQPGARRGWAFFPQAAGYFGVYEKDRVKQFYGAIDGSLGLPARATKETGGELASGALRGLRLQVLVEQAIDNKTGQPMRDGTGKPITNAIWSPIAQSRADVQTSAAKMAPPRPVAAPTQQPQYAQQNQQPQYAQPPQQAYQPQPQYAQPPQQQYAPPQQGYPQQPPAQQYAPPQGYPPGVTPPGQAPAGAPSFLQGLRTNGNG